MTLSQFKILPLFLLCSVSFAIKFNPPIKARFVRFGFKSVAEYETRTTGANMKASLDSEFHRSEWLKKIEDGDEIRKIQDSTTIASETSAVGSKTDPVAEMYKEYIDAARGDIKIKPQDAYHCRHRLIQYDPAQILRMAPKDLGLADKSAKSTAITIYQRTVIGTLDDVAESLNRSIVNKSKPPVTDADKIVLSLFERRKKAIEQLKSELEDPKLKVFDDIPDKPLAENSRIILKKVEDLVREAQRKEFEQLAAHLEANTQGRGDLGPMGATGNRAKKHN